MFLIYIIFFFFFFQAEDGIRDATVTGVQTCALPISPRIASHVERPRVRLVDPLELRTSDRPRELRYLEPFGRWCVRHVIEFTTDVAAGRSSERRPSRTASTSAVCMRPRSSPSPRGGEFARFGGRGCASRGQSGKLVAELWR